MGTIHLLDICNAWFVSICYFVGDQRTLLAKSMIEQGIRNILATMGNEIKIHRLDEENMILEIDYEKYIKQILKLIEKPGDR
jgi:hypothetical protein